MENLYNNTYIHNIPKNTDHCVNIDTTHLINIDKKITHMENKIDTLDTKLNMIMELLDKDISTDCKKMSKHIDFVNEVYTKIKNPLGFLVNKVNSVLHITNNNSNITN